MESEIVIEILENGNLRFRRSNSKIDNDQMIKILYEIIDDYGHIEEIARYLQEAEEIELIVGEHTLCG